MNNVAVKHQVNYDTNLWDKTDQYSHLSKTATTIQMSSNEITHLMQEQLHIDSNCKEFQPQQKLNHEAFIFKQL